MKSNNKWYWIIWFFFVVAFIVSVIIVIKLVIIVIKLNAIEKEGELTRAEFESRFQAEWEARPEADPDWCGFRDADIYGNPRTYFTQSLTVKLHDEKYNPNTGYCFSLLYKPAHPEQIPWASDKNESPLGKFYDTADIKLPRTGNNDKLYLTIRNETTEIKLACVLMQRFDKVINFSQPETYNCIFRGETKATNLTWEQLNGMACESYKVYCG